MSEPLGDHLRVDACPQGQGGVGVPQVMETDGRQHGVLHGLAKVAAHDLGV